MNYLLCWYFFFFVVVVKSTLLLNISHKKKKKKIKPSIKLWINITVDVITKLLPKVNEYQRNSENVYFIGERT